MIPATSPRPALSLLQLHPQVLPPLLLWGFLRQFGAINVTALAAELASTPNGAGAGAAKLIHGVETTVGLSSCLGSTWVAGLDTAAKAKVDLATHQRARELRWGWPCERSVVLRIYRIR